jgi:hypothetical protein
MTRPLEADLPQSVARLMRVEAHAWAYFALDRGSNLDGSGCPLGL